MPAPLDPEERQRIIDLLPSGKSCNEIARLTGRGTSTVSRIAREVGHEWAQTNALRAREARSGYAAEVRAVIAEKAAQRALQILDGFEDKQPVVVGGGGDAGAEVLSVELDARGQRDRASAAQILTRTVLDIAKLDEKADDGRGRSLLERLVEVAEQAVSGSSGSGQA